MIFVLWIRSEASYYYYRNFVFAFQSSQLSEQTEGLSIFDIKLIDLGGDNNSFVKQTYNLLYYNYFLSVGNKGQKIQCNPFLKKLETICTDGFN